MIQSFQQMWNSADPVFGRSRRLFARALFIAALALVLLMSAYGYMLMTGFQAIRDRMTGGDGTLLITSGMRYFGLMALAGWGTLGVALLLGAWSFYEQREATLKQTH